MDREARASLFNGASPTFCISQSLRDALNDYPHTGSKGIDLAQAVDEYICSNNDGTRDWLYSNPYYPTKGGTTVHVFLSPHRVLIQDRPKELRIGMSVHEGQLGMEVFTRKGNSSEPHPDLFATKGLRFALAFLRAHPTTRWQSGVDDWTRNSDNFLAYESALKQGKSPLDACLNTFSGNIFNTWGYKPQSIEPRQGYRGEYVHVTFAPVTLR